MTVTAEKVRELRDRTGAGMMDCKKALEASGGDLEAAVDVLRKQGLKSAAKKADRQTAEGRVLSVVADDHRRGTLLSVACETDFLAKGEGFRDLLAKLETVVREHDPLTAEDGERALADLPRPDGDGTVRDLLQEAVGQMGENIRLVELVRLENREGLVGTYVHHDGKHAAIASVTTKASPDEADAVLRSLCQHVVVFRPEVARREEVDADAVERERAVLLEAGDLAKKPEEIREKIVSGRMEKFYAGVVLAEQPWIHDDKRPVRAALEQELGDDAELAAFARVQIG